MSASRQRLLAEQGPRSRHVLRCLLAAVAGSVLAQPAASQQTGRELRVVSVPTTVYKVGDARGSTESWTFDLVVLDDQEGDDIVAERLTVELIAGEEVRETVELGDSSLSAMRRTSYRLTSDTDPLSLRHRFSLAEAFDLRLAFSGRPRAWNVDRVRAALELRGPGGGSVTKTIDVPIRVYDQQTALRFPLRDPAIVTQGTIHNGGHSGHANQFAIDVMGLNEGWGPVAPGQQGNAVFAGWGRDVVAPAAGRVVYARNDVPDNAAEGGDPRSLYGQLSDPVLATAGNAVVIDHGNGEFSALMHMREGSVTVGVGDSVRQGQVIGALGNSGDSFGAHLHYQLQDGPELFRANSLPARFEELGGTVLERGVFFEAGGG